MKFLTLNEQILLLTIWKLGDNAYPVSIRDEVIKITKKNVVYGTLYNSLDYIVKKGYVKTRRGEPTSERGGKRKIYFSLTDNGISALQHSKNFYETLWQDVEKFVLSSKQSD